ncbi:MAG TPA: hypothetical protein VK427_12725, partial [Kofleriaceae bacterium]|nr:hypothetical protein [Kofleriaceae bacterium]
PATASCCSAMSSIRMFATGKDTIIGERAIDVSATVEHLEDAPRDRPGLPRLVLFCSTSVAAFDQSQRPQAAAVRQLDEALERAGAAVTTPDGSEMEVATDVVPVDSDWFGSQHQILAVTRTDADVVFSAIANGQREWVARVASRYVESVEYLGEFRGKWLFKLSSRRSTTIVSAEIVDGSSLFCSRRNRAVPHSLRRQTRLLWSGRPGSRYGISEAELSSGTSRCST